MSLNRAAIWGQGWYITLNPLLVFGAKMGTNPTIINFESVTTRNNYKSYPVMCNYGNKISLVHKLFIEIILL